MRYGRKTFRSGRDLQTGKAGVAIVEKDLEELNKADGADKVLKKLNKLHLKDKLQVAYEAYDVSKKFERPLDMGIGKYVAELERSYNRGK